MVRTLLTAIALGAISVASAAPKHWPIPNLYQPPTPSGQPEVLFTFDDGPHESYTPRILDSLERHGVQAIFFWNGYRVGYRSATRDARVEAARDAVEAGHLVGNHTVNHVRLCQISKAAAAREIDRNTEILERVTEMPLVLFRAPYGDRCPQLESLLAERGLRHHHWDIDSEEWDSADSELVADLVIDRLSTLRGRAIILLHDTHGSTPRSLEIILHWIEIENADRRREGKKEIKILSASEYVAEKMDVSLYRWASGELDRAGRSLRGRLLGLIPGDAGEVDGPRIVVSGD
jgi:peptidoglycan/xylan/chitin deacetylase (PgdA/CDA1 family)